MPKNIYFSFNLCFFQINKTQINTNKKRISINSINYLYINPNYFSRLEECFYIA